MLNGKPHFLCSEKSPDVCQEVSKSADIAPKGVFWGTDKNIIQSCVSCILNPLVPGVH